MTAADPQAAVEITVDGVPVAAEPGEMLIEACERNGTYIPRFCYHRRMSPVGMCRMCLVDVDTGRGPSLQPSCMVPVAPGMKVLTESEAAKKAQDGVLEFLLINHPLDCPVCDKGGECPLQDQTMAYGPGETRFVEEKRHFAKPVAISETVYLDRERCILCDRCTRFADEVAGDALIHFMGRGNLTEVNTFPDEPFASYFSGNTVQICPVGALTAKPYRFKARPWDLTETVSTAWVDSVGSRVAVQASRNRVLRVLGVDCDAVNWGWLSDKERFGFEALNSPERLGTPLIRDAVGDEGFEFRQGGWGEALGQVAEALAAAAPERVAVLGGARLTNESQYMWAKLAKGVIGTDNVDAQMGDGLDPALVLGLPRATIDEACRPGGTVVLIGPDPKEELGTLYLRLRHAVVNDGVKLIEVVPRATGLSQLAAHSLRPAPGTTAQLAQALVLAVDPERPEPSSGDETADRASATESQAQTAEAVRAAATACGVAVDQVEEAAQALAAADGGVTVIVGRASLAEPAEAVEAAALELAELPSARFLSALRRGNVYGALHAGLAPGLLPGRIGPPDPGTDRAEALDHAWPTRPQTEGLDAHGVLEAAARGDVDVLVLLGADPLNDFPDRNLAYRGLRGAALVVSVDLFLNDSADLAANVVLAAAGPTERDGTFTNLESRISATSRKVTPPGTARPDWMIASELADRLNPGTGLESHEAIQAELAAVSKIHQQLTEQAPEANSTEGTLLPATGATNEAGGWRRGQAAGGGRQPAGRTASVTGPASREESLGEGAPASFKLIAARTMYDDGMMLRHCPSSRGLAPTATARVNPSELPRIGLADGTPVRVSSDCGHIEAVLAVDKAVPEGTLAVNWIAPGAPANTLLSVGEAVTLVRVDAL